MPSISANSFKTVKSLESQGNKTINLFRQIVKTQGVGQTTLKSIGFTDDDAKPLLKEGLIAVTPKGIYVPSARGLTFADDLNSLGF